MVKRKLDLYFNKSISKKIQRERKLIKSLIQGIDLYGVVVLCRAKKENSFLIDTIQMNNGLGMIYVDFVLGFFSDKLFCDDVEKAVINTTLAFSENGVLFSSARGEVLIGKLNSDQPVIASGVINTALKSLLEMERTP